MNQATTIYLKDYTPPAYLVDEVHLCFTLHPTQTVVRSSVTYRRNHAAAHDTPLSLDGDNLQLLAIELNGEPLSTHAYSIDNHKLTIGNLPQQFELAITTQINPEANTALEGLYRSSGNYCTQCEAQGFRRITYYQDRPDVMAPFHVKIIADKTQCPILLSNGNPVCSGDIEDGRHWLEWFDPFAKPAYLFALVAGNLAWVEDSFTTQSGRVIALKIFTEAHHIHQCDHAMASLKRAMAWDEQRFGLEYDLDLFMIVAVDDFNMGAMENKGLNIFNSRLVFASPTTATDDDYIAIEAVIGHEYFHNWTGDRVTCRDWFQLSLKEGLTVFRDREFTADMHSAAVKRIEDVRLLRTHQFAEDASPMAHPIRPSSYMEINNFYTVTVYEKGAEVVHLYQSLLGVEGFRKGMDLYFARHDGQAVTTEDFLAAMADANHQDLSLMQHWYTQAGTPVLSIHMDYDAQAQTCTLHCSQTCPSTPESKHKEAFLIPIRMGLLDAHGKAIPLILSDDSPTHPHASERTLLLTQAQQSFTFHHISSQPLPSLLRGFSAPVALSYPYSAADNAFLMQHDTDAFNRWAAAQRLTQQSMLNTISRQTPHEPYITQAFQHLLADDTLDDALKAEALMLPSEADIAEQCALANPPLIHQVREDLRRWIASHLSTELEAMYLKLNQSKGLSDEAMQQRKLKNICLSYLTQGNEQNHTALAYQQFQQADNMTDQYAALLCLAQMDGEQRRLALSQFEQQWQHDSNVMDKWFAAQASAALPHTLASVKALMQHPKFDLKNPNKVRALIGSFAMRNPANFHAKDGSGYQFVAEQVIALDRLNPQIASRMVRSLIHWKRLEPTFGALMRAQLQTIADTPAISSDVFEIVSKSLN